MHFAVLPPEINSGRMYAGPGVGPMLAAASAWDELNSAAADFDSVISSLTSDPWQGPSSASMASSAAPQADWLRTTATRATQTSSQAGSPPRALRLARPRARRPATRNQ